MFWRGGAVSELEAQMRLTSIARLSRGKEMRQRVLELAQAKVRDDEIAALFNGEGTQIAELRGESPAHRRAAHPSACRRPAARTTDAMAAFARLPERARTRRALETIDSFFLKVTFVCRGTFYLGCIVPERHTTAIN
jgi:hypothetical protein